MALIRTSRLGEGSGPAFGTGAFVTGSFTPSNSSLLVVVVVASEQAGHAADVGDTFTVSGGGHTYTRRIVMNNVTYWASGAAIWTAPVTTGASMTLTVDCGAYNISQYRVFAIDYTGYDTGTPTGVTGTAAGGVTNGAETLTLSGSPASDSEVVAAMLTGAVGTQSSVTHGTGWTELYDIANSGDFGSGHVQVRTGSTSSTIDWDDVSETGALYRNDRLALEILAAAGGGGLSIPVAMHHYNNFGR